MSGVFKDGDDQESQVDEIGKQIVDKECVIRNGEETHFQDRPAAAAAVFPELSTRLFTEVTISINAAWAD